MSRFRATCLVSLVAALVAVFWLDGRAQRTALIALAAALLLIMIAGVSSIRMRLFCDAFCRGCADRRWVALTFDDGPDEHATAVLLDLLKRVSTPAAFFVVGVKAEAQPDLVRRMRDEGHLIGNHTHHHYWWTNFLVGFWLRREIELGQTAIMRTAEISPDLFRPPMGLTNPHYRMAMRRLSLTVVGWDVRGFDRRVRSPGRVVRRVLGRVRPGSVIALHDGAADPAALVTLVDNLICRLRADGYEIVRLDRMMPVSPPAANPRVHRA